MGLLDQKSAKELLVRYGVPVPKTVLVKNKTGLDNHNIPFPAVLKVDSPDIIHKSDSGMILTSLQNFSDLKEAIGNLEEKLSNEFPEAKLNSFVIQEQVRGHETIMGMKRDPAFGPVIMFGLGGIFVEVLKDVSFRIAPLSRTDALNMIKEIKGYKVLKGMRGNKPVNITALVDVLVKLSKMSIDNKNFSEIDFNPVFISQKTARVVDVRIMVDEE